jgi:hypothetical protein
MTVHVDEQNYKMEQSYNLALAIWSLLEQNAASLRADGAPDAMISFVQQEAVAEILAEVCDATGADENESIRVFLENYYNIRDNPSSIRHHGEPLEPEEELPADPAGQSLPIEWRSSRRDTAN